MKKNNKVDSTRNHSSIDDAYQKMVRKSDIYELLDPVKRATDKKKKRTVHDSDVFDLIVPGRDSETDAHENINSALTAASDKIYATEYDSRLYSNTYDCKETKPSVKKQTER